jgi:hypothetical protein
MNRKIRTAIATLAALVALSATGLTGVASAASRPTEGGVFAIAHNGVAEAFNDGRFWKYVQGWSIGGGGSTITDGDCQDYADAIGFAMDGAAISVANGNYSGAYQWLTIAEAHEDKALEDDCVILYT